MKCPNCNKLTEENKMCECGILTLSSMEGVDLPVRFIDSYSGESVHPSDFEDHVVAGRKYE